jgi:hypothetical protein
VDLNDYSGFVPFETASSYLCPGNKKKNENKNVLPLKTVRLFDKTTSQIKTSGYSFTIMRNKVLIAGTKNISLGH